MPSIRHHLTIAEASLFTARAHLESAFTHCIDAHYDPNWTHAIDDLNSEIAHAAIQVGNIKTMIEPPADPHP